jgi:hypothetical protein
MEALRKDEQNGDSCQHSFGKIARKANNKVVTSNSHAIAQFNENEIFYSQGEMYYKSPRGISKW